MESSGRPGLLSVVDVSAELLLEDPHFLQLKASCCNLLFPQVCPVCSMRAGVDMVAHITLQHGNIFKMQCKRKSGKASSHSTLSFLRRELREGNFQSLFRRSSSCIANSIDSAPDPLLSSFILPVAEDHESISPDSSVEASLIEKSTSVERKIEQPLMFVKDKEEKAKRSDFVQGVVLSVMLDDNL